MPSLQSESADPILIAWSSKPRAAWRSDILTLPQLLAIVEPARRACCTVEPELAQVLLGRMEYPADSGSSEESRQWSLAQTDGTIPPPSLQIVMDRLYRHVLNEAGHRPPLDNASGKDWEPPQLTLSLDHYRAMGGAGQILADYVSSALDEVPRLRGDREMAITLLKVYLEHSITYGQVPEQ